MLPPGGLYRPPAGGSMIAGSRCRELRARPPGRRKGRQSDSELSEQEQDAGTE